MLWRHQILVPLLFFTRKASEPGSEWINGTLSNIAIGAQHNARGEKFSSPFATLLVIGIDGIEVPGAEEVQHLVGDASHLQLPTCIIRDLIEHTALGQSAARSVSGHIAINSRGVTTTSDTRKDEYQELLAIRLARKDVVQLAVAAVAETTKNRLRIVDSIWLEGIAWNIVVGKLTLDGIVMKFHLLAITECLCLEPVFCSIEFLGGGFYLVLAPLASFGPNKQLEHTDIA